MSIYTLIDGTSSLDRCGLNSRHNCHNSTAKWVEMRMLERSRISFADF